MNTQICPKCQLSNRPNAQFCARCGAPLSGAGGASRCPQCQAPIRPSARFCATCGYTLQGAQAAAPAAQPSAEVSEKMLVARWPGGQTEEHRLTQAVVHVGRGPTNDVVLDYPTVSKQHFRLQLSPQAVQVTDLHSTNGTMIKGRQIPPGAPTLWRPGETLRVGDLRGNSISLELKTPGATPALHTYPLGMHRLAQYDRVTIGRDPNTQVHLNHPTVSRNHAEIVRQNGTRIIRDLGSSNGTFLNGQRVTHDTPLNMGDVIQIGPYKLVYDGRAERLATSVSKGHRLDAMDLGFQIPDGRMILENISLSVKGGEFIALVGGSGAGKSTLLKAMNGYQPATHGQMLIDGIPLYPSLDAYRNLMGYVPQDDIIHKVLPVRRALWYSAKLRLPDATQAEIERRIGDVLDMVEMTAHAEKPVRVLSGGQRKRVSIAVELLAEPDLLFLDEPTSGLDPGLEKKMMYDLNRLADQGRTVVLITHATMNIEQCHHVAFLVQGNLAYYGPPHEATSFFKSQDFADIYLKLTEEVNPQQGKPPSAEIQPYYPQVQAHRNGAPLPAGLLWAEHYRRSPVYDTYVQHRQAQVAQQQTPQAASSARQVQPQKTRDSAFRQLFLLARRQFDLIRHDMRTLFILLLMMPLIAGLFAIVSHEDDLTGWQLSPQRVEDRLLADLQKEIGVYDEEDLTAVHSGKNERYTPAPDASSLIMMLGLALTQAGTFGAAFEMVKERPIFRRERAVNLKVGAYVLSKVFILSAFAVIQVASSLLILSLAVDMGFDPVFTFFPNGSTEMFVTLFLAVVTSIMLGLFISAIVPNSDVVLYVILIQLFVQIILSGSNLFPLPESGITTLVSKGVVSHWTMKGMGTSVGLEDLNEESRICQVGESTVILPDGSEETHYGFGCESGGKVELSMDYEHSEEQLATTWAALAAQIVFWGGLTMIVQARQKPD
jgi:ABC transport system ATP-binding/permease protein